MPYRPPPSSFDWRSSLRRYALAIGILASIIAIQTLLLFFSIKISFTIPIIVGLVAAGWYGGRGPGIFLASLIMLITAYSTPPTPDTTQGQWLFAQASNLALMIFIVFVITERRSIAWRAQEAAERYEKLFQNNPFPMWIYDIETLRFLAVNKAASDIYGYSTDEFLQMTVKDIRPEEDIQALLEDIGATDPDAIQGPTLWKHRRRDGVVIDVEITSDGLLYEGRKARRVLANDVTERVRAEKELERRVAERTTELRSVNRELESFSYSVSHDLRAPLRAMDGFSLALVEDYGDQLDDNGKNFLERIRNASQQMSRLIDDLLSLSRVTRSELRQAEVDLTSITKEIVERLEEHQPREHTEFDVQDDIKVQGDERLLRIALENLLSNAWKFTSKTDNPRISFRRVTEDNGNSVYCVSDNGAGFDMKYAGKLFGAFQRLHSITEFDGTGIGLATVQRIINRHGGRIWAEGEVGKGAAFYFTI